MTVLYLGFTYYVESTNAFLHAANHVIGRKGGLRGGDLASWGGGS